MEHIWIYKDLEDQWTVFNAFDQASLNHALLHSTHSPISVLGGRCDAIVSQRFMQTVYDIEPKEMRFQKASWFVEGSPFLESEDQILTDWYLSDASKTTIVHIGDREIYKTSDGSVMMAGQRLLSVARPVVQVHASGYSIPEALCDTPITPCSHLILAVHGIGESLWSKKAFSLKPFDVNCSIFRSILAESDETSRTEILSINWFHILSNSAYTKRIADITLPSIPVFRQIANEAIADVIFYMNPEHRDAIVSHVAERIVHIVTLFKQRNPSWNNRLSLIGHSLGSVVCADVLSLEKLPPEIHVSNLFLFGSPLGLFLTARGQSSILPIPQCARVFNIIQPNDPVAYRLEPFLVPVTESTDPAIIPNHKTGGLAATTQVKHTASSILGIFSSEGESTYFQKISQVVKGPSEPSPESPVGIGLSVIHNLNGGNRIDWAVQQGFMAGATEYADALTAHVAYFDNRDIAKFVYNHLNQ
jgi:hypothetical protein